MSGRHALPPLPHRGGAGDWEQVGTYLPTFVGGVSQVDSRLGRVCRPRVSSPEPRASTNITHTHTIHSRTHSAKGENSYAHQNDLELGVALVDRFTDATSEYVSQLAERVAPLHQGGHNRYQHQLLPRVREYMGQVGIAECCVVL
jgi:hypothetical protein